MEEREKLYLEALARRDHEQAMLLAIAPPVWRPDGKEEQDPVQRALWVARSRWWQDKMG